MVLDGQMDRWEGAHLKTSSKDINQVKEALCCRQKSFPMIETSILNQGIIPYL